MKTAVMERFLGFVIHDTQSAYDVEGMPTTAKQLEFAEVLAEECWSIGLSQVNVDKYGYVTATLHGNCKGPVIGFLAHMDTSPDAPGAGVAPQVVYNYDGGDIPLNSEIVLSAKEFPGLKAYKGQTIITTGGRTLLGADNKAGVAEILTAMEYLIQHPEIPHGKIRIAFTPDEEVGKGADNFDVEAFGAEFAYTVDGGQLGELESENFNAARAKIEITGKSVHPGTAKGVMINAGLLAVEMISAFPREETPAATEGIQGFYHLTSIKAEVGGAYLDYAIRDFDPEGFERRKEFVKGLVERMNGKYGKNTVRLRLYDEYLNMGEKIDESILALAKRAFDMAGVEILHIPVRGGTDGARLSFMGLPCPNIFTGGHNFHGPYEFIPVESMEKAVEVIINICKLGGSYNECL